MIILYILLALFFITIIAMLAGYWHNKQLEKKLERGEIEEIPELVTVDEECCGQHELCEKDSLLAAVSKDVEYYNDEELDRFRGRTSEEYTEADSEEFREIFYTMKSEEVAGWVRSLQLRGIELPDGIKDEVFLVVGERRI